MSLDYITNICYLEVFFKSRKQALVFHPSSEYPRTMEYISTKEASQRWGISERRVRSLCAEGKIEGASRCGAWVWSIPVGTQKPADGRTLRYMKNRSLRTGSQDYSQVDRLKSGMNTAPLSSEQKAKLVLEALKYDNTEICLDNIRQIFNLNSQISIPLEKQILALNMRAALSFIPFTLNEKSLLDLHRRMVMSIDDKNAGFYNIAGNQSQETEAMFKQYNGPWSVLHPVARAAFLFSEILRINPFEKANTEIAFVLLANEMHKAKLPPVFFGIDQIPELKAALASTTIRGNCHNLVQMIINSLTGSN